MQSFTQSYASSKLAPTCTQYYQCISTNMDENLLKIFLELIADEQNFVNYVLKIEPISSGGANYTSTLHNITISEGTRRLRLFAKVAAFGKKIRANAPNIFEIESMAYKTIIKSYEKLQDEFKLASEHRLTFSKFYGYNSEMYEEVLVLEDLVAAGYETYDRFKSVDWKYSKFAINELAKMHALAFAYSVYYPKEFNNIIEDIKFKWISYDNSQLEVHFKSVVKKAVETTREVHKDKMQRYFDSLEEVPTFYNKWELRPVLGHGDFRPSNLLHKVRDDGTMDIKIVDLQTIQGSTPVIDLLYFIFTGSDEKFRAQYYDKLIDHYYTQLHAAMKRLHLDPEKIYSRADFDHELKEKLPFGLSISIFALPVVTVEVENAPKVNEDLDLADFSVDNTSDLYTERLNGVINDYVKWGILK